MYIYWHCLRQAPVEDRYYTNNNNVVPLYLVRLPTNFMLFGDFAPFRPQRVNTISKYLANAYLVNA